MNNESTGNLIMCVKVSLSKQSFGVWKKEYKDNHETKTNKKIDNGKNVQYVLADTILIGLSIRVSLKMTFSRCSLLM